MGKINKVTIALDPPKFAAEDVRQLDAANHGGTRQQLAALPRTAVGS
jgi:hypothetical protein